MFKNFDMKKFALTVLMVAIGAFFIGGLVLVSTGGIKKTNWNTESIQETKTVSMNNVQNISVGSSSADVVVEPEDRTDLKAELKANVSKDIKYRFKLTAEKNGNDINISLNNNHMFSFFDFDMMTVNNLTLYIYVPKNYANNIAVDCTSGDIKISDFNIKELKAKTSSGDVEIKNINSDKFLCECTSGSIQGEKITTKDGNADTSSGDIKLSEYTGNIDASASSGSINLNFIKMPEKIDGESSSGDIRVSLPSDSKFSADAETTSGDINCDFPITINKGESDRQTLKGTVGSDENKMNLKATSGSIDIIKK